MYCGACYRETGSRLAGKGRRVRVTVERLGKCACGTQLNQYNFSGECGACRDRRIQDAIAEVLAGEGAKKLDLPSLMSQAKRETKA
jgi:hypothetical protein